MPTNTSPEYKKAEAEYRRATDPQDRLAALNEMHSTIPKHKGTEHLRADIKTRIKELTESHAGPKKGGTRTGPPTVVRREGAAQVAILGPPNTGKSTLHAAVTGSHSDAAPYPFTTQYPVPGMLPVDDISIQLVDLPPISPEHPVPWIANALGPADAALLVVDLSHTNCVEESMALHAILTRGGGAQPEEPLSIELEVGAASMDLQLGPSPRAIVREVVAAPVRLTRSRRSVTTG